MSLAPDRFARAPRGESPPTPTRPAGLKRWEGPKVYGLPAVVFGPACDAPGVLKVVVHLAGMGPHHHYYRHVDIGTLAAMTGVCPRSIDNAIGWLKMQGLIDVSRWRRPGARGTETIVWLAWNLPESPGNPASPGRNRPRTIPFPSDVDAPPLDATGCVGAARTAVAAKRADATGCETATQPAASALLCMSLEFEQKTENVQVQARHVCSLLPEEGPEAAESLEISPPAPPDPTPDAVVFDPESVTSDDVMAVLDTLPDSIRAAIKAEAEAAADEERRKTRGRVMVSTKLREIALARYADRFLAAPSAHQATAEIRAVASPQPSKSVADRIEALVPGASADVASLAEEASSMAELADNPDFTRRTERVFGLALQGRLEAKILADNYRRIKLLPLTKRGKAWGAFLRKECKRRGIEPVPGARGAGALTAKLYARSPQVKHPGETPLLSPGNEPGHHPQV